MNATAATTNSLDNQSRPTYALRPAGSTRQVWPLNTLVSVSTGLVATGGAPLLVGGGSTTMVGAATISAGAAALWVTTAIRRQRRSEIEDAARAALERVAGPVTRYHVRNWRRTPSNRFIGAPRRIRFRYQPAAVLNDKGVWPTAGVAVLGGVLGGRYRITRHDPRRGTMTLRWALPVIEAAQDPRQERAAELIKQLFGQSANVISEIATTVDGNALSQVTVDHECGIKATFASWRDRVARVVTTMLEGRWRADWDLESDRVTFRLRPDMPDFVQRPAPLTDPKHPDFWKIPLGVNEDGRAICWDLDSSEPHFLCSGKTGKGKAIEISTVVPTLTGWTTMGQLQEGDKILDDQGHPTAVTGVFDQPQGRECFEVEFSDGAKIVADAEHQWWTEDRSTRTRRWFRRQSRLRKTLLAPEQTAALRATAQACDAEERLTIPEAAAILGVAATASWIHQTAALVGGADLRTRTVENHYRDQVVTQRQQVRLYDGPRTAAYLRELGTVGRQNRWSAQLSSYQTEKAEVSLADISASSGVPAGAIYARLSRSDVPSRTAQRQVQLSVPAKEIRRSFGTVAAYPKAVFLLALADRGDQVSRDQRPSHPTGGQVRTTRQILDTLHTATGHLNHSIPTTRPLELPTANLRVPPYTLGCWLGDGCSWDPRITSADPDLIDRIRAEGFEVSEHHLVTDEYKNCRQYYVRDLHHHLKALGLLKTGKSQPSQKRIPSNYLRASIQQRRALLAGLLDTDGTVSPQGTTQFTTVLPGLADDVEELIVSLGYRVSRVAGEAKLNGRVTGPKWTLSFTTADPVFRLSRKLHALQERTKHHKPERNSLRYITAIRPVPEVPMRCITVDSPNHLFLAGRAMIPTHNTNVLRGVVMELAARQLKTWLIDPKRIELIALRGWPNVQLVATTIEHQVAAILQLWQVMEDRYAAIEAGDAREEDFDMLVLVVDEFAEFTRRISSWWTSIKRPNAGMPAACPVLEAFDSLVRLGRSARIRIAIGIQRPDARFFGESAEARDNFDSRLSLGRLSPDGSRMMYGSSVGCSLPGIRGRAIASPGDDAWEIQTYWVPDPRRVSDNPAEQAALDLLRPTGALHEPLRIVIPEPARDDKGRPLVWEAVTAATLEPASDDDLEQPDDLDQLDEVGELDPELHHEGDEAGDLDDEVETQPDGEASNDVAQTGDDAAPPTEGNPAHPAERPKTDSEAVSAETRSQRSRSAKKPVRDTARTTSRTTGGRTSRGATTGTVVQFRPRGRAQSHVEPADDYGPADQTPAAEVVDGDLILIDDRWVVVEAAEPDPTDDQNIGLAWRSIDDHSDDQGTEFVGMTHPVARRSPID